MITGYNFPEGVQYKLRYSIGWDFYDSSLKLPSNMSHAFVYQPIVTIKLWDASNVTDMSSMFSGCQQLTTIPQLDTSKVTDMSSMLNYCSVLTSIPLLDCSSVTGTGDMFSYSTLSNLTDIGGFKNLKVSWKNYFLNSVPNATVESLMNVINNLWDWTDYPDGKVTNPNGTVVSYGTTHTLKFGTTNLNKLTAEQKAVATNKGWTLT
jgi:surface protein